MFIVLSLVIAITVFHLTVHLTCIEPTKTGGYKSPPKMVDISLNGNVFHCHQSSDGVFRLDDGSILIIGPNETYTLKYIDSGVLVEEN